MIGSFTTTTRIFQGFSQLNLAGITKFKYEKKNEKDSGRSSKMTSSWKWPIGNLKKKTHTANWVITQAYQSRCSCWRPSSFKGQNHLSLLNPLTHRVSWKTKTMPTEIGFPMILTSGAARCTVMWLPNFLGWIDFLSFAALLKLQNLVRD